MASSSTPVALAAGTHIWEPTPENIAFQDELLTIIRKHGVTRLDTARAYVCRTLSEAFLSCSLSFFQVQFANIVCGISARRPI